MPSRKAKRLFGSHSACPLAEIQRRRNVFRFAGELFSGLAAGKIPKRTILSTGDMRKGEAMRNLRFAVTIRGPLQKMTGELLLQIDGTQVSGTLRTGEQSSYFQGRMLRRNRFAAAVRLRTEIYEEDCDMLLRLQEPGTVRGSVIGARDTWTIEGTGTEVDGPLQLAKNL